MKTFTMLSTLCLVLLAPAHSPAQESDVEGSKDHPLLNRMPGYYIERYEEKEYDTHQFRDANLNELNVEGHVVAIVYAVKSGAKEASRVQVLRNYETAVTKIGGTVLKSDWDGSSFMKVVKDGKEIWVHIDAYITSEIKLTVVEKKSMAQEIVANADAFSGDIRSTGHAAVYGIYFDTGKSLVKPASDPALAEIAKLLKRDPALQLNVVGHTDNVGGMESNMKLSEARAQAVVQALTGKYGIAVSRLRPWGVGPLSPVASNDSEEGRGKNRRVELVKQ
ncbi:MAG TPA: OmpA family protein [Bacteroidota bacterium]|nr:OmpA family protein [Bacteroidota bacterium]